MTTFLRFFLLALTPLLGVTLSLGPAFFFGLTVLLVLTAVATLNAFLRPVLKDQAVLWSDLGLGVVVVTVVDLVTTLWLPGLRAAWGVYLNLVAFLPLVVLVPLERPAAGLSDELFQAAKTGLLLTFLLTVTALFREALGHGTLTLIPGPDAPAAQDWPLSIFVTGAGGFFLAAAAVVVYRLIRPRLERIAFLGSFWGQTAPQPADAEAAPAAPKAKPAKVEPAGKAAPTAKGAPAPKAEASALESIDQWGEDLASAATALAAGNEKSRLLVIGAGNGELAYYLAMVGLDRFKVRGVDHFSTRVETAVRGVYRDHQVEFIPQALRDSWLTKGTGDERHLYRVADEPRKHVQFEVADFQNGQVFFPQPAHLIVLNQGIEYVSDDKKRLLLQMVCDNLVAGGALVVTGPFKRELLPEGMKRTGTTVFRKS
jgi:Na+-translocating ferredoxin:NAD+ oxidoreductase RnfE subunit